jgi:hypothetical protein
MEHRKIIPFEERKKLIPLKEFQPVKKDHQAVIISMDEIREKRAQREYALRNFTVNGVMNTEIIKILKKDIEVIRSELSPRSLTYNVKIDSVEGLMSDIISSLGQYTSEQVDDFIRVTEKSKQVIVSLYGLVSALRKMEEEARMDEDLDEIRSTLDKFNTLAQRVSLK